MTSFLTNPIALLVYLNDHCNTQTHSHYSLFLTEFKFLPFLASLDHMDTNKHPLRN